MSNVFYLKGTPSASRNSNISQEIDTAIQYESAETVARGKIENLIFGRYRPAYVKSLLDLSAAELAAQLGISIHTWRSYECNRRQLTPTMVAKLEKLFEERVAMLMQCGK